MSNNIKRRKKAKAKRASSQKHEALMKQHAKRKQEIMINELIQKMVAEQAAKSESELENKPDEIIETI